MPTKITTILLQFTIHLKKGLPSWLLQSVKVLGYWIEFGLKCAEKALQG